MKPKPIVLTHSLRDGSLTEAKPIILKWNGVEMPEVLRTVKPGQYLLLPVEPSAHVLPSPKEAA